VTWSSSSSPTRKPSSPPIPSVLVRRANVAALCLAAVTRATRRSQAPKTVEAFTKYAKEGLYDGTAFHRSPPPERPYMSDFTSNSARRRARAGSARG